MIVLDTLSLLHDLANPLTAACLSLEKINSFELSKNLPQLEKYLEILNISVDSMKNYLISAKLDANADSQALCLNTGIESAIKILQEKAQIARVDLCFENPKDAIYLRINQTHFSRVMSNLITNAIESYSNPNLNYLQRKVKVSLLQKSGQVIISVQDWGEGIAKQCLAQIFKPFFSTKKSSGGTGLGLAITKAIVEQKFWGSLDCQSDLGKGSTFRLVLPITAYS